MPGDRVRIVASLDDRVSGGLTKIRDKFDQLGGKGSAASLFGNVGAKAVALGFNLITDAAQGAVNIISSSVDAAIADERSVTKLGASLKANVPTWDGNTAAIERNFRSKMNLGFADEEQRDSLARLLPVTHDVNKALDIQSIAMDLARFKGISLAEASDALIKVEAGQYRALKSLGIVLKAGATQTEALAAVEKVAAGQTEAFANSNEGRLLRSQVLVNEAMENFGRTILPVVAEAANDVAFAFDRSLVPLNKLKQAAEAGVVPARAQLEALKKVAAENKVSVEDLYAAWSGSGQSIEDAARSLAMTVHEHLGKTQDDMIALAVETNAAADATETSFDRMGDAVRHYDDDLNRSRSVVTGYFDLVIAKDDLAAANTAAATAKTTAERHKAQQDQFRLLEDLAKNGGATSRVFTTTIDGLMKKLKTAHGDEAKAIRAEIDLLNILAARANIAAAAVQFPGNQIANNRGRASGGPVSAGGIYTVGESGPETLVMGRSGGYVLPTGGGGGGGGGGTTIHTTIMLDGRVLAQVVDNYLAGSFGRAAPTLGRT